MAKLETIVEDGTVYALRAGTPIYVKTADICSMTGKSNQWIGQLVSQGTLHKKPTAHGSLFDLTATLRAYCDMLEARVGRSDNDQEAAKLAAEIKLKQAKADIAELEAQELRGKMHRSEDVEAMTADLIYTIRGSLLALPGRLAVDVAAVGTPAEVAEIIRKEVYALMQELTQYRYDSKKYEERVRARMDWDTDISTVDNDYD